MDSTIIQQIAIWALPLIFAITVHEVAHGWVASKFGDQTARYAGRLTLNPVNHIDWFGTIILPVMLLVLKSPILFGWAKPVPVDARNLRNPRPQMVLVSLAGPLSNLLMALIWGLIAKAAFYFPAWFSKPMILMGLAGIKINVMLGVLNLLPIPPLDGGRVLSNLLPPRIAAQFDQLERYGFLLLIILMVTNILGRLLYPPIVFFINLIMSVCGLY